MKYPTRNMILGLEITGGYAPIAKRYGITITEVAEIYAHGKVSEDTRAWADDLRGRCPKAFAVPHVD